MRRLRSKPFVPRTKLCEKYPQHEFGILRRDESTRYDCRQGWLSGDVLVAQYRGNLTLRQRCRMLLLDG